LRFTDWPLFASESLSYRFCLIFSPAPMTLCARCLSETLPSPQVYGIPTLEDIRSNRPMEQYFPEAEITSIYSRFVNAISDIDKQIKRLKDARCSVLSEMDRLRWIRAPVRRLPVEVLQQIFLAFCGSRGSCMQYGTSTDKYTVRVEPLLTWVCYRWRSIAVNMPALWSTIYTARRTVRTAIDKRSMSISSALLSIR
jgi:hypothetical protein